MRSIRCLVLILLASNVALSTSATSIDRARQLQQEGDLEAALQEVERFLQTDAADAEKVEALDLLASIAVEKGDLRTAQRAWQRLVSDYPDLAEGTDAHTKLSLVSALIEATGGPPGPLVADAAEPPPPAAGPAEPPTAPPPAKTPAAPPDAAPEPATAGAPEAADEAAAAAPAKTPATAPPPAGEATGEAPATAAAPPSPPSPTPAPSSRLVLVAGRGRPHDAVKETTDRIVEFLRQRGVDAASATGGIPVVRESELVLPLLLQKGQEEAAASVLLLTAEYESLQKMVLDCYTPVGAELWTVRVAGGTGWTGRASALSGLNENLLERTLAKLGKKVGDLCLPVGSR